MVRMIKRKVIITHNSNVTHSFADVKHPFVSKYWVLPRGYCLLEFSHPAFQLTMDSQFATSIWDDTTRSLAASAENEQRALLEPLYASLSSPSDAVMLLVPTASTMYEFIGKEKRTTQWPDLGCSLGWDRLAKLRVAGRFVAATREDLLEQQRRLEANFDEWVEAIEPLGVHIQRLNMNFVGTYFSATVIFSQSAGDALMGLYLLLTLDRSKLGIGCVGFFDPDDFETSFLEIGGSRRTEQIRV